MNRKKVRLWMLQNDIRGKDVAADLGVTRSMVYHWLAGRRTSETIRRWFLHRGCPGRFLDQAA